MCKTITETRIVQQIRLPERQARKSQSWLDVTYVSLSIRQAPTSRATRGRINWIKRIDSRVTCTENICTGRLQRLNQLGEMTWQEHVIVVEKAQILGGRSGAARSIPTHAPEPRLDEATPGPGARAR